MPVVIFFGNIAGIQKNDPYDQEQKQAIITVDEFYNQLASKNYNSVMEHLDDRWFQGMDRTKTENFFKSLDDKLGAVKTRETSSWEVKKYSEKDGGRSGMYVTYIINTAREKFGATETIVLFKNSKTGKYLIVNHDLRSEGFDDKAQ